MKISPARSAAFDILSRIERDKAFSSILLPEYEASLGPRDRALCHNLTLGVLRRQIYLDRLVDLLSGGKKLDAAVRIALRIGLYQLHYLDRVPDHSAVNESVDLVRRAKKSSAKGLVNAILRRSIRERATPVGTDEVDQLVLDTSHPRWLLEKWIGRWGLDEAAKLAFANNEPPHLSFRYTVKSNRIHELQNVRTSTLVEGCFIADALTPELAAAAERGEIYFQDEGSQLVGSLVPASNDKQRVLDVCAAPGSKLTQIASRGVGGKGLFVGGDLRMARARFLLENCRRQGLTAVQILQYDAGSALPFAVGTFDSVLVDAPCSGTGTIRHNPELRYLVDAKDFAVLFDKQRRILENASKLVAPEGILVYSTCSLEPEENEAVADAFQPNSKEFVSVRPNVPAALITANERVQTMPQRDGTDGFFVAMFQRTGH